jgi:hypothetical protein
MKSANDKRVRHDANMNSTRYRATADENAGLFYALDVGAEYVTKPVCQNAFRNILGIFRKPWERLKSNCSYGAYVPGPIAHGNVGTKHRHTASNQRRCEASVCAYLQQLLDEYASPYATRFIREKTSVGLRNDEVGAQELPSNMTKHSIYSGWCYLQGFKAKSDAKGNFGCISSYEIRPYDDILWPEGSQSAICSWSSFLKIWKKHFPHLKIRNSCEDVCGECVRLRNSFEHLKRKKKKEEALRVQEEAAESSSSSSDGEVEAGNDEDDISDDELIEGLNQAEFPEEYLWFKANQHAVQAQAQRLIAQQREEEAKQSRELPHEERRFVPIELNLACLLILSLLLT